MFLKNILALACAALIGGSFTGCYGKDSKKCSKGKKSSESKKNNKKCQKCKACGMSKKECKC
ncbi:hypothetical protein JKY79_01450 [Candidatus Babeliales bacterium]|nr:hypothetical protein [Candidatus Babeliales bacterium]